MQRIKKKLQQYALLMRFDKPIGILLLLWPALWALWFASAGKPDPLIVAIFIAGVVIMRAAGCIVNDLADRNIDVHIERTRERPLAAKKIKPREAIVLFFLLGGVAFALVLMLNHFTICLAFVGMLLTLIYPFMKRFTHLPQVGLGAAFSWSVIMAFAAVNNAVPLGAWLLFFTALLWPVIYDTMYAMTDRRDDIKAGIKSTAILFGKHDKSIIALLQSIFLVCLAVCGFIFTMALPYYFSLFAAAGLFLYQQFLIKDREPKQCFNAFLNNNWVGFIIFVGIVWSYSI